MLCWGIAFRQYFEDWVLILREKKCILNRVWEIPYPYGLDLPRAISPDEPKEQKPMSLQADDEWRINDR